jgi:hypothetical protein
VADVIVVTVVRSNFRYASRMLFAVVACLTKREPSLP